MLVFQARRAFHLVAGSFDDPADVAERIALPCRVALPGGTARRSNRPAITCKPLRGYGFGKRLSIITFHAFHLRYQPTIGMTLMLIQHVIYDAR